MVRKDKGFGFFIKWLVGIGDLLILNGVFLCTYWIFHFSEITDIASRFDIVLLLLNFSYFIVLYFVPLKIDQPVVHIDKIVQRSLLLVLAHGILFSAALFFLSLGDVMVQFLVYYYFGLLIIFALWRIFARQMLKWYRSSGKNYKSVVIVGAGKNGLALYSEMDNSVAYGYKILGFFDDNVLLRNSIPHYVGGIWELDAFVENHQVDDIYCTLPSSQDEKIKHIMTLAERNMIRFHIVPEFSRYLKKSFVLTSIESLPIMDIRSEPLQHTHNRVLKRMFDLLFSFVFLITLYPFFYVILGALIKFSSPGPILFKQLRTGWYGKEFYCYKFRSMKMNDESDQKQAVKGDDRNTPFGDFLRRSSLDEIPQFFNVLKGDMSVVGPRPHMLKHTEMYSFIIDKYMVRHLVKPGITGWAQINGCRGETDTVDKMEERVKKDVWYIENWSFFLDLKIIFVTMINMIKGDKNAY